MPPMDLTPLMGCYLSFHEREEIAILSAQGMGIWATARRVGRSPSTISRELRRNAATRCGKLEYRASVAQWKAELVAQRPKTAKLVTNERLREYVQDRLSGAVHAPDAERSARRARPGRGGTSLIVVTAVGCRDGARSRSPTGFGSISPMMSPCGSAMRPSTRRSTSKAAAHSSVNSSPVCVPDGHFELREQELDASPGLTSRRR